MGGEINWSGLYDRWASKYYVKVWRSEYSKSQAPTQCNFPAVVTATIAQSIKFPIPHHFCCQLYGLELGRCTDIL